MPWIPEAVWRSLTSEVQYLRAKLDAALEDARAARAELDKLTAVASDAQYLRTRLDAALEDARTTREAHDKLATVAERLHGLLGGASAAAAVPAEREALASAFARTYPPAVRQAILRVAPAGSEQHEAVVRWCEERLEAGLAPDLVAKTLLDGGDE